MTTPTQGLVAGAVAAVLIRISWSGEYLNFVQPWMRWPLLATGVLLLAMAVRPALGMLAHSERVPSTTWLLLVPVVVMFTVAPPPLGAYIAERRASTPATTELAAPVRIAPATDGGPVHLAIEEFTWGASQKEDLMGLTNQPVELEGFVSRDKAGDWYVTTLVIFCCAADVAVERVKVVGPESPPRDQWVRVTGTWVEGTGRNRETPAQIAVDQLVEIPTPADTYR
jgi:uncharacterized repeat protein (TIGR03943 family)